ncbi:threonine/serine exporter family protein [uncultured Clostridium sp.]|uniref:threonine/serine ThrE exporter family protein n=1 Tax=uncultured Clostridium sp. TaxID=59620 RepID=UPI00262ED0E8|nr:threonine/serine exporter family protein [uncultured Clostridium sp.]
MENKIIETMNIEKILCFALDIAENMLRCNAEINRVEDTVIRICKSYGDVKVDVFAIKTLIIATIRNTNAESFTQTRRVHSSEINLEKLEELNRLSRYICENKPSEVEIEKKINTFRLTDFSITTKNLLGGILGSTGFCVYFGGGARDVVAVGIIAIIVFFINKYAKRFTVNPIVYTTIISFIIGWLAIISVKIGIGANVDKIIIGDVMLVIPGMAMVTGFRDMLTGDILAGTIRLIDTILITVAITCGFALALYTGGFM